MNLKDQIADMRKVDEDTFREEQKSAVDSIFGSKPPAEEPPAEEPPAEEPPAEEPPAEEPPAEEPPAEEPPAEGDFDFDASLENPPAEEPTAEENPAEEEESPSDGNPLRAQLQTVGRELKVLKAEHSEIVLETERLREENATLKGQVETASVVNVDPSTHPEVQQYIGQIRNNLNDFELDLSNTHADTMTSNAGALIDAYQDARDAPQVERRAAMQKFKNDLYKKFGENPDYLEEGEEAPHDFTVDKVFGFIKDNAAIMQQASTKADEITELAKNKTLATGAGEYEKTANKFSAILEPLGKLSDEVIDANPHAPEAAVAKLIRDSPAAAKRAEAAKVAIVEMLAGKRPLNQKEMDSIVANFDGEGDAIKDFNKQRATAETSLRSNMAKKLFQGLMLLSDYEEKSRGYEKFKSKSDSFEGEVDALDATTRRVRHAETKKVDTRPKDKPSARHALTDAIFGGR